MSISCIHFADAARNTNQSINQSINQLYTSTEYYLLGCSWLSPQKRYSLCEGQPEISSLANWWEEIRSNVWTLWWCKSLWQGNKERSGRPGGRYECITSHVSIWLRINQHIFCKHIFLLISSWPSYLNVDIYMYILLKEFFRRRNIQNLALFVACHWCYFLQILTIINENF